MSSWSSWLAERSAEIASSHRVQLGITAAVSAGVGVGAVVGLQNARRWYNVHDLKGSIPDIDSPHHIDKVRFQAPPPGHS